MRISYESSYVCSSDLDERHDKEQADDQAQYGCFGHGRAASFDPADAVGRRDDVRDTNAVSFVDDNDFALGNQVAVDEDVHGLAGQAVQLYNRALADRKSTRLNSSH